MADLVKLFFFCRMFAINQPGSGSNRWEKQNDQKERNISCFIFWHFYGKTCDPLNYIYILRWLAQPGGLTKWKWKRTHELVSFSIELGYFLEQGKFIKTKRIIRGEHVKRINVFLHMMRVRIMINIVKSTFDDGYLFLIIYSSFPFLPCADCYTLSWFSLTLGYPTAQPSGDGWKARAWTTSWYVEFEEIYNQFIVALKVVK